MVKKTVDHPKDPFKAAAQTPEVEVVFESDFDDNLNDKDENTLRGNTDPKHDPKNVKNRGLTPPGIASMFGKPRNPGQEPPKQKGPIRGQPASEERQEELLNGNYMTEDEFNGLRVRTIIADKPSARGIRNGQITEMAVTEGEYGNEADLALFKDGEWKMPAKTTPERHAIMNTVVKYNPECLKSREQSQESEKSAKHGIDMDNGKNNGKSR